MGKQKHLLYFAYGANMNLRSMAHRCPGAKALGKLVLPDWELVFRGCADIVPNKGKKVRGVLWRITPDCEKSLDRFEGFPNLYIKRFFEIRLKDLAELGMFYVMREKRTPSPPSDHYFKTIHTGYRTFGHNPKHLVRAAEAALPLEDFNQLEFLDGHVNWADAEAGNWWENGR